ncbi:hypothetical protein ACTU44_16650 [Thalassospira sp. SM2505]
MGEFSRYLMISGLTVACYLSAASLVKSGGKAQAAEPALPLIVWQQAPSPPAVIIDGPSAGDGYLQRTTDWLISHLPGYRHEKRMVPIPRALDVMAKGEFMCSNFLYESDYRRNFLIFSDPLLELQALTMFIAPEKLNELRYAMRDGMVDLGLLAHQNKLSIGMPVGYRFDEALVPGVNDFLQSKMTQSAGTTEMTIRLFDVSRIDGFISYQVNVNYYREAGELGRETIPVPIMGVPVRPLPVSCSGDKKQAQQIIDAVNSLLSDQQNRQELEAFYDRWAAATP